MNNSNTFSSARRAALFALMAATLSMTLVGCAGNIPNTTVEDTPENRDVVSFLEEYREAVQERNVRRLLDLASPAYFDDNGTPGGDDDIDYEGLRDHLAQWRDRVLDVRYDIKYLRVTWEDQRVWIQYRYTARFQTASADGEEHWERRLGDNRIELSREDDDSNQRFRILSGM